MRRTGNLVRIYLHFIWTTKNRTPIIDQDAERIIHGTAAKKAHEFDCSLIAVNGTNDHVHLLMRVPATVMPSEIIKHVKGVSAFHINKLRQSESGPRFRFQWQNGYAVYSVSSGAVKSIKSYIDRQKEHHANEALRQELEVPGEDEVGEV